MFEIKPNFKFDWIHVLQLSALILLALSIYFPTFLFNIYAPLNKPMQIMIAFWILLISLAYEHYIQK